MGERFPLLDTANRKAALALLPGAVSAALVERVWKREAGSARGMGRALSEIDGVRRAGVAFDVDEHTVGISAIGAAFVAPTGQVHALSIPVPSQRFAKNRRGLERMLRSALAEIGRVMEG